MIVVVIIGILALVAIPAYQKYIISSKMAEAYNVIEVIGKSQLAFFSQNQEFRQIGFSNPQYLTQPMVIVTDSEWETFGYPVSVGSNVYFSYRTWAGKIDESGTEVVTSLSTGNSFMTLSDDGISRGHMTSSGPICNSGLVSAEILGATIQANLNWAGIYAVGDLNNDQGTSCTAISRLITVTGNDKDPFTSGFITMNVGQ